MTTKCAKFLDCLPGRKIKAGMKRCFLLLLFAASFAGLYAQSQGGAAGPAHSGGDTPAQRYFLWIRQLADEGRWEETRAALDRADDFSSELSDISFLRAQLYMRESKSRHLVLETILRAIAVSQWTHYTEEEARFAAAQQLVALRRYAEALDQLARLRDNADRAALALTAMKGLCSEFSAAADFDAAGFVARRSEFRRSMLETMDRYPRDPRPLKIFLEYAESRISGNNEESISDPDYFLMEIALRRLPMALEACPDLAWMAAPFINGKEEKRRLMAAYRAGSLVPHAAENFQPHPNSIAGALELSLISAEQAVDELFASAALDRDNIIRISDLMDSEENRNLFMRRLLSFTGTIYADDDMDGIQETKVSYNDGALREYRLDEDQDGIADLHISFINGVPQWAQHTSDSAGGGIGRTLVTWEKYPCVLRAEADGMVYIPRPMEFFYTPVYFTEISGSDAYSGLLFPYCDKAGMRLDFRTLAFYALQIQRPSGGINGAVEWIDMEFGLPRRISEILDGRPVSVTEFKNGQPVIQWIDLDNDSRMETMRRFREIEYMSNNPLDFRLIAESSQSDWDNDGVFETGEEYLLDGSVVYSYDMDGSGIRNYSETRAGNANNESKRE